MKAWELIEQGWQSPHSFVGDFVVQHRGAADARGKMVGYTDPDAISFCIVSAIGRAYDIRPVSALFTDPAPAPIKQVADAAGLTAGGQSLAFRLAEWNDMEGRTKEEVVALLKRLDI